MGLLNINTAPSYGNYLLDKNTLTQVLPALLTQATRRVVCALLIILFYNRAHGADCRCGTEMWFSVKRSLNF